MDLSLQREAAEKEPEKPKNWLPAGFRFDRAGAFVSVKGGSGGKYDITAGGVLRFELWKGVMLSMRASVSLLTQKGSDSTGLVVSGDLQSAASNAFGIRGLFLRGRVTYRYTPSYTQRDVVKQIDETKPEQKRLWVCGSINFRETDEEAKSRQSDEVAHISKAADCQSTYPGFQVIVAVKNMGKPDQCWVGASRLRLEDVLEVYKLAKGDKAEKPPAKDDKKKDGEGKDLMKDTERHFFLEDLMLVLTNCERSAGMFVLRCFFR